MPLKRRPLVGCLLLMWVTAFTIALALFIVLLIGVNLIGRGGQ